MALSLRRAIQYFEERQPIWPYEQALLRPVLEILHTWFNLPSIINNRMLRDEVEESMVSLYYLDCWRQATNPEHFVVIDVCGDKGIFSLLLQNDARQHWPAQQLREIVLLEKVTSQQIDWSHLKALSDPPITLLENCNLHDTDELVETFHDAHSITDYAGESTWRRPLSLRIADEERILQVRRYEFDQDRKERIKPHLLRKSRRNPVEKGSFHCQGVGHEVSECPLLLSAMLRQRDVGNWGPCWKCGEVRHFRKNCSNSPLAVKSQEMQTISVAGVVDSSHPLSVYCERLPLAFHNRAIKVIEKGLENRGHSSTNWNSQRKSLFIVHVPSI